MPKNPKVKLGLKNLAMLPGYFDYIFEYRIKKTVPLRSELSPKFLSTLGPKLDSKSPARFTTLTYVVFKFTGVL